MATDILLAVPTFETVTTETFKSIYDLYIPKNCKIELSFIKSYDCARARNQIVNLALKKHFDFIFMVDSDIILPEFALDDLLQEPTDILFGIYPRKDEPNKSEIFSYEFGDYSPAARWNINELKNYPSDRIQVGGGGFGCTLLNTDIFTEKHRLPRPWFKYVDYGNGELLSEDLYFCAQAKEAGIKMYVDTRVICGHVGKKIL